MLQLVVNRSLIGRLCQREFNQRYRGSLLGWFWALFAPLSMLTVYSLVFGSFLGARWPRPETAGPDMQFGFPIILFSGLIVFGIFAEVLNRAPSLMLENPSYIKKVRFPLEIMPFVSLLSALTTAGVSFVAFFSVYIILYGLPPWTVILVPVALIPLGLTALGISYFLSSIGVFIRDLTHIMPPVTTSLLFLSSVFFDVSSIQSKLSFLLYFNPVTISVNHVRDLIFWRTIPNPVEYIIFLSSAAAVYFAGHFWFNRTKKAFADVV